jgi:hypothetical protein
MLFVDGGLAVVVFALWVFCVIDVITTPQLLCRNLPKPVWLIIVILLPDVGSIAWLVAGRPWAARQPDLAAEGDRGGRPPRPAARVTSPDDDEEFIARLRARAEEQRRRGREAQQRDEPPATEPPSA